MVSDATAKKAIRYIYNGDILHVIVANDEATKSDDSDNDIAHQEALATSILVAWDTVKGNVSGDSTSIAAAGANIANQEKIHLHILTPAGSGAIGIAQAFVDGIGSTTANTAFSDLIDPVKTDIEAAADVDGVGGLYAKDSVADTDGIKPKIEKLFTFLGQIQGKTTKLMHGLWRLRVLEYNRYMIMLVQVLILRT